MSYEYISIESDCHKGFTEIVPGLLVGKKYHLDKETISNLDVLIPLDSVDSDIWKYGYRKMIMYVPTKDYGVLPIDVEEHFVNQTLKLLAKGKKVAIFCVGGHGRTGYFASLVLGKLGIEDPIAFLREKYCKKAVEDQCQVEAIADFLNHPEWKETYKIEPRWSYASSKWYDEWWEKNNKKNTKCAAGETCENCTYWVEYKYYNGFGKCYNKDITCEKTDIACNKFISVYDSK